MASADDFLNSIPQNPTTAPTRSVPGSTVPAAPIVSADEYLAKVHKEQNPNEKSPLPGISPENSAWDYIKGASNAVVGGAANLADIVTNPASVSKAATDLMGLPSRHRAEDIRGPVLSNLAEENLPNKPNDQLGAAISGAAEGALNPLNLMFGPPGAVAGAIGGGVTAWRNAASPDTPWRNLAFGTIAGFSPVNTTLRVLRAGAEKLGLLAPSNPIFEAAANTGVNARTAGGVGENSLTNATRMLRESPFSSAIDKTEEKGREQLQGAVENQMQKLGISGLPEEETKAVAGSKLTRELGNIQNPNSGGWVNDTKNSLAGHQLVINNAIDPATTNIPISNMFNEIKQAVFPPVGAENTLSAGTRDLWNKINQDYMTSPTPAGTMSLAAIQTWKRHIGDLLDTNLFANSNTPSKDLNLMWGKLSDAEKLAYKGTPYEDQFNTLQQGWKEYFSNREYVKKLVDENITPGTAINDLLSQKSADGEKLKRIFELVPGARNEVAAYYLKNMGTGTDGQFNPDRFFKQWGNPRVLSPEAKLELFKGPNGDIPKIYDYLALMAKEQARSEASKNPSRTGVVNELFRLTRQFTHLAVAPAIGYGAYNYDQTGDMAGSGERGAVAGAAAYAAAMMLGPKLFTNPAFVRLIGTNPPMDKLPVVLRAFASSNPGLAQEVTALQNYIEQQPKFMSGGLVNSTESPNGYAGGGPGAKWQTMSEGYVGGGVISTPFGPNNDGILGYAEGGEIANENERSGTNILDFFLGRHRPLGGGGMGGPSMGKNMSPEENLANQIANSMPQGGSPREGFAARPGKGGAQWDHQMDTWWPPFNTRNTANDQLGIRMPRNFFNEASGGYIEASAMGYADGGPADNNPDLAILDMIIPGWQAMGIPEEKAGGKIPNANDRAGFEALQQERIDTTNDTPRDAKLNEIGEYLRTKDKTAPKAYAEGGSVDRFAQAVDYFKTNLGLEDHQARGAVKYMYKNESGLDPHIVNPSSGAYGIAQHLGSRQRALFSEYSKRPTFENQLEFIGKELKGLEGGAFKNLKNAKTEKEAYDVWGRDFERPLASDLVKAGVNYKEGDVKAYASNSRKPQQSPQQEEASPASVLNHFLIAANEPEQEQEQKPDNVHDNLIATIDAAPWANPETKFAARHILAEST